MGKARRGKDVIKELDEVVLLRPRCIERWGYPISFDQMCDRMETTYAKEVSEALKVLGLSRHQRGWPRLLRALAYCKLHKEGFGGAERKIFFRKLSDEFIGRRFRVLSTRMINTGTYYPPSGSWSNSNYDGEYDYEPGGLENMKRHKLLEVYIGFDQVLTSNITWLHQDDVEKVHPECTTCIVVGPGGKEYQHEQKKRSAAGWRY